MLRSICNSTALLLKRSLSSMGEAKTFEAAVKRLSSLKNEPDSSTKLKIYALFKQATSGECVSSKPGLLDVVGRAKWTAWKQLATMSQADAQANYTKLVNELAAQESPPTSSSSSSSSSTDPSQGGDLLTSMEGKVFKIVFNRPNKKNAILRGMYEDFVVAMKEAAESEASVAVVTGNGDFYSSGNDLTNITSVNLSQIRHEAVKGAHVLKTFVASIIDFPKPLIALVNGPSIGIATTTLGLFDTVYASDKATFHTPFSQMGQSPEGCSSVTFPSILGNALATEMLFFSRKISAQQAKEAGLVSEVLPSTSFQQEAWKRVHQYSLLPPQSLRSCKGVVREGARALLHAANERECTELVERWSSEECKQAVFGFFDSKL